jgi:acyl-CoA synthetase (AMP-forming)/AMP-acid ligase II
MNVAELLHAQALARPAAPAIIQTRHGHTQCITYAELEDAAARGAALLSAGGLRPGDAVLVLQPVSIELYVVLIALFRLGLVAVLIDPGAGRAHLERCCALASPRALVAAPKAHLLRLLSPALRAIPRTFVIGQSVPGATPWSGSAHLAPLAEIVPCAPETPALLTFTSGSTGLPRGAVRSHGLLQAQLRALQRSLAYRPGEVSLTALPVFVLADLASGVTSVLPDCDLRHPGAIDPAPLARQLQQHRVTRAGASPALWARLADHCLRHDLRLPHLHTVLTGGAPVFPPLLDALRRMAPRAEIVAVYGATEAEPIATLSLRHLAAPEVAATAAGRGLLAGTPVDEVALRILPDRWGKPLGPYTSAEFDANCLGAGEPGEIVVAGAHVLRGYLHGCGDAATTIHAGDTAWHRTGDAGYLDGQGRLWLLGRCAARIAGERGTLYPLAVEGALSLLPQVRRAAVVARGGRRIVLVEPSEPMGAADLAALKDRLAWAAIDEVQLWPRIPVDTRHNAKIDYPALSRALDRPPLGFAGTLRRAALAACAWLAARWPRRHLPPDGSPGPSASRKVTQR